MADKKNNNLIHFQAEKILYDLEHQIKTIGKTYGEFSIKDSLEAIKISRAILRKELEVEDDDDIFEVDVDSFRGMNDG